MNVAVYGTNGRTGAFVVSELQRRGHEPIAITRRIASLDDSVSLDRALHGARAVINCAGPFLDTAQPLIEAALRCGIPYLDITAEQESARSTIALFHARARERGIAIVPAVGFFGALGDLLATAAMGDWTQADRIDIAIALDSWWPTIGTRRTGARNTVPRLVCRNGNLERFTMSAPRQWTFPEPFHTEEIVEVPFTEAILISQHLDVCEIHNYMNLAPLADINDPNTPPPIAVDEHGRSNQLFAIDVVVRKGEEERRARARGRDIYAITAPLVVEAAERLCTSIPRAGAYALGELVDAEDFLQSIARGGAAFTSQLP